LYSSTYYSICRHLRTLPRGQHFNVFTWTHRSINSTKIPITYPAASTTKIGATVNRLTSIIDGCSSGSFETTNCLRILSRIPLSRISANLWRKLYYIKSSTHFHFEKILRKLYSYGCMQSKEKHRLINHADDIATVRYVKALLLCLRQILC
jgi:hypothetical protein